MIAIINYGIGNLDSVERAFRHVDAAAKIVTRPEELDAATHLVLPGVGAFDEAMENLHASGFAEVLERKVHAEHVPLLGICLGFQMLTKRSEEGRAPGLGWIDAETKRFDFSGRDPAPKIPHLGWNDLDVRKDSPLLAGISHAACYYFAHSYCVSCDDPSAVLAATSYGYEFVSAVHRDNIFATQFHPEKSHNNGLQLIRNFVGYTSDA